MITSSEAEQTILASAPLTASTSVPLGKAAGHIIRDDVYADRDQPPFDRVAMDGYAFNCSDSETRNRRTFKIAAVQRAGAPPLELQDTDACIEVTTGSVLPLGCDCVVRYEDTTVKDKIMSLATSYSPSLMHNVHKQGNDSRAGDLILQCGRRLTSPDIAILAAVGKTTVLVDAKPNVWVVSTGDELVDVGEEIEPYQIRQSNRYAITAALRELGIHNVRADHCRDDKFQLRNRLENILSEADVVILTGGVSMGKYDYVPEVLSELGIDVAFHKVKQRPGKPFWFGTRKDKTFVFALPGNPVSALVCFVRYVRPFLRKQSGEKFCSMEYAKLKIAVTFDKPLTYFVPIKLHFSADGELVAEPVKTGGSGDFGSLAKTDGFVELDAATDVFPARTAVPLYRWRCS